MGWILFENGALIDPEGGSPLGERLLVRGDRIAARLRGADDAPDDATRIDLGGGYLCPGLVDLHCHGAAVFHRSDHPDGLEAALASDATAMARHGVTAWLVTTVSGSRDALRRFLAGTASCVAEPSRSGAVPLGIHLEGPWINPRAAGAQPEAGIRPFDARHDASLLDLGAGLVKLVTLAPEVPGASQLQKELERRGIVAALGHSLADVDAVDDAVTRGARHVTHLFNAMGAMHHRAPGLAGAALADPRLSCDLICDGVHVHPAMVALAARAKGSGLALVTDRIDPPEPASGGFGSGALRRDGSAWRLPGGALAGSCVHLDEAMRNLQRFAGLPLAEAVAACSLRPARLLGIEAERGTLRPGARADLVVLDPELRVRQTWVGGRRVYPD